MRESGWLSSLYQEFRRELFITAWTVLRRTELAEDAVHAAFVKLVQLKEEPRDAKSYVFRSVRNAALDLLKTRSRRREEALHECDSLPAAESTPNSSLDELLSETLERLDDASREIIELHLHARLTFQEIAELRAEPLSTIASRYRRALTKLSNKVRVPHE